MGLSTIALCLCNSPYNTRKQNPTSPFLHGLRPLVTERRIFRLPATFSGMAHTQILTTNSLPVTPCNAPLKPKNAQNLHPAFLQLATSAILFVGFSARACTAAPGRIPIVPVSTSQTVQEKRIVSNDDNYDSSFEVNSDNVVVGKSDIVANIEDNELKAAFESWKSKTYALTVPLRIVALRGSVPPSWVKDFVQVQGRKLKLQSEFRGRLEDIFSDLCMAFSKGNPESKSAVTADVVTIGDSWLSLAIKKGIIEPILGVEGQDWFKGLSDKWKVYLCRNSEGELDSNGVVWAAPYRWGSMVIAYKKSKFKERNMAPIEDWKDLWRPELAGKISMVDSPREVIGAVLKYMGASYNTNDIDLQVTGGKNSALQNLILLQKQVRLFDSVHYLKAFGVGDVWVTVGWSSDVIPAAKRMSNVAVIVPKSGASLWADLWAIPGATKFSTNRIGGRVRGASPLIHQWIEFCLQAARALPFKQEVIPGASPFTLEDKIEGSPEFTKGKPKLDTNLIAGVPPPEILERCEFLEPLSEAALKDYQWLVANMNKPGHGPMWEHITAMVQSFGLNSHLR